jgi:prevent-host-death family protein
MTEVSIRDLRNHGGDVIDRVERGEEVTITRSGKPVAELRPVRRPRGTPTDVAIENAKHLPRMDPDKLRRDIDAIVDQHI